MILQRTTCTWVCESHKLTEPSGLRPGDASDTYQDSGSIREETCANFSRLIFFCQVKTPVSAAGMERPCAVG